MMSIEQYFQSHPELASQLEAARESFSKHPAKISFTAFVLSQKIVLEEDYLVWAQVHFGLVILSNDYFQLHSPDMALWDRWKNSFAWNNECLPVGEWDGVLFVGCFDKPQNFDLSVPVCFALCSPVHLNNWSEKYIKPVMSTVTKSAATELKSFENETSAEKNATNLISSVPAVLAPKTASVAASLKVLPAATPEKPAAGTSDDLFNLELMDDGPSEDSQKSESSEEEFLELIQGIDEIPVPTENSFLLEVNKFKPQLTKSEVSQAIENISIDDLVPKIFENTVSKLEDPVTPGLGLKVPTTANAPAKLKTPALPKAAPLKVNPVAAVAPVAKAALTAFAVPPTAHAVPTFGMKASPGVNSAAIPIKAQPKISTPISEKKTYQFFLTKALAATKSLSDEIKSLCEPLNSNFDKYMILSVDDTEAVIRPVIWSEGFNPGVPNYEISIKIPSIFYIVGATYKPYHGPLSPNEMNEKFFDDWNLSQTPGHATLVPLIHQDRLVGILFALGESTAYNNHVLRSAAKVAGEIIHKVAGKSQKAAA